MRAKRYWWVRALDSVPAGMAMAQLSSSASKRSSSFFFSSRTMFTHLSLVLAGNYHVSFQEAEAIKQDYARHREILPVVRPVVEKMAAIVQDQLDQFLMIHG